MKSGKEVRSYLDKNKMKNFIKLLGYKVTKLPGHGGSFAAVMVALTLLVPATTFAETVVRTGDSISIGVGQTVENNLYAAAGSVSLSGEVKEDMYVMAGSVTTNGPIGADFTALGGTIQSHASVGGDLRAVGGDVIIASDVGGDVFVVGGHLKILSSAKIAGNVYFYGGEADIEGVVEGSVMGRGDIFSINNSVAGTDITARKVVLGDQANIQGDLQYKSIYELERSIGATVSGDVLSSTIEEKDDQRNMIPLIFLMAWLFASLSVLLFFRTRVEELLIGLKKNPVRAGVLGILAIAAAPVLAVILIATLLGSWIGVVLLLVTILFILVSLILLPLLFGSYLLSFYRKKLWIDIWAAFLGMLAIVVIGYIPLIGGLFIALAVLMVMGAILYSLYRFGHR